MTRARTETTTPTETEQRPERPPAPPGSAAAVLALPQTAGNQAVARLLARTPAGPIPPEPQPTDETWLDMETIRDETKAEILTAFVVFCDACDANVTAMKAAAKAQAEAAALFIDIAAGFLAP